MERARKHRHVSYRIYDVVAVVVVDDVGANDVFFWFYPNACSQSVGSNGNARVLWFDVGKKKYVY